MKSSGLEDSSAVSLEETLDLRRVRDEIPIRLWCVAFIGLWERAAFWGLTAPWQNYMQHPPAKTHSDTSGALGLGQVKATRIYCAFYIGYYVTPIAFAFVSDNYLGRYRTLLICTSLYTFGCAMLTFSSMPKSLDKGWGVPGLVITMVLIDLGGGGFYSLMPAFLADQYTETAGRVKKLKSGESVLVDRALTVEYIMNVYYWLGNVGSLSCFATVYLEKNVSFSCAFALPFGFIVVTLLSLLAGWKWYVRVPHKSKIFLQVFKILFCALRTGFRMARADPAYQLAHCHKLVSWNRRLVDELARGLQACRVLLAFIFFYVCFDQMQNNFISQASQMETHGTPNDLLPSMNQVGCILAVPLIQNVLYPLLHRRRIYLRPITRITIGFGFTAAALLYATLVQKAIYSTGPCYKHPNNCNPANGIRRPNHVNVWIQTPIYLLIATGETFAQVTGLEYALTNAPKDMKSIVQSINLIIAGVGSAFAMGPSPLAHDPYLVIFYGCIATTMAVTTAVFWYLFRKYDKDQQHDHVEEPQLELDEDSNIQNSSATQTTLVLPSSTSIITLKRTSNEGVEKKDRYPESYGRHQRVR